MKLQVIFLLFITFIPIAVLSYEAGQENERKRQQKRRCTQSKFGDRDCTSSTKAVK